MWDHDEVLTGFGYWDLHDAVEEHDLIVTGGETFNWLCSAWELIPLAFAPWATSVRSSSGSKSTSTDGSKGMVDTGGWLPGSWSLAVARSIGRKGCIRSGCWNGSSQGPPTPLSDVEGQLVLGFAHGLPVGPEIRLILDRPDRTIRARVIGQALYSSNDRRIFASGQRCCPHAGSGSSRDPFAAPDEGS